MENYLEINYEKNMQILSQAIKYCDESYSHNDIIKVLKGDNDIEKQLCLIELNKINSQEEANILVFNLTQHSGPVRETAGYKIAELISKEEFKPFFQTKEILNTFVKAITDINPSVSRYAIEIINYVDDSKYLYEQILEELKITIENLDTETKNRSYVQNKKNFNLYWNLEAIINLSNKIEATTELIDILKITAQSNDYTIREKTAKTAYLYNLKEVINLLKNDTNIYVKKYL
ncbi:MAG: hypothetical protein E7Z90_02830 [Cyanobacteria bacterium SIG29]|nr:hypothetical protein [Cyanobacteria bacterium SIG29]